EFVDAVDLASKRQRVVIGVVARDALELAVQHADDFRGLVVDDAPRARVPQRRHRHLAGVARIRRRVGLVQVMEAVHLVRRTVRKLWIRLEGPALLAQTRNGVRHRKCALQFLEREEDQHPVRPRAVPSHVQVIAACLGLVARRAVGGDAVAKHALDALELARRAGLLRQLLLAPGAVDQDAHASFSTCGQGSGSSFSNGALSCAVMRSSSSFFTDGRARMRSYHSAIFGLCAQIFASRRRSSRRMYGMTAASASEKCPPASQAPSCSAASIIFCSFSWWPSASCTYFESSPCSATSRLYSVRCLLGDLARR